MSAHDSSASLLILGLGNVLCSDDGLGVAALELLERRHWTPEGVRVLDGGTLGLSLLTHIRASDDVIIVDAINGDGPPGTFVRLDGDEVAPAVRSRLSAHQVGVADLLDALGMLDAYPRRLVLLGLVPASLELNYGCSPPVEERLPELVEEIVEEARRLGYDLPPAGGERRPGSATRSPAARTRGV